MKKIRVFLAVSLPALILFSSCAKEVTESNRDLEQKILDAYIKVVYHDTLKPTASGTYVINERTGTGTGVETGCGVYVRYSITDLKNNYAETSVDSIAKLLGTYSKANYYGPVLWETGYYTIIEGVEQALLTQREGAKFKVIVPSWMSSFGYDGSSKEHNTTTIYEVEVLKVIKDLQLYVEDTLSAYNAKYWGNEMDTTSGTYYFKTLDKGSGDTLKKGDNVQIWYVGKLLDGFVFDTNIEDTARKYGIYQSGKTYAALSHTLADTVSSANNADALVKGFEISLWRMSHGGKAVAFFSPGLGYGSTSETFGKYQPLFFYIYVKPE